MSQRKPRTLLARPLLAVGIVGAGAIASGCLFQIQNGVGPIYDMADAVDLAPSPLDSGNPIRPPQDLAPAPPKDIGNSFFDIGSGPDLSVATDDGGAPIEADGGKAGDGG